MTNGQFKMPSVNSQGPVGQRLQGGPQASRLHLASMLDSPEMIALQQLSASSSHHVGNFQSNQQSGGNPLASAELSSSENQLHMASRDSVQDKKHTPMSSKGKSGINCQIFNILH